MSFETGVVIAMAIGIAGGAVLTGWCIWSVRQEKQNMD